MANNLVAYYRLGDEVGSYSVQDSSGNGNTGSLIDGDTGMPAYGATGVFLYDSDGALDLTNGQNIAGAGGFSTNDLSTESPTIHDPLTNAEEWTIEMWFQWTGGTTVPAAAIIPPGLTTPISEQTGFPEGVFSDPAAASVVVSSTYSAVGDIAILGVYVTSGTVTLDEVDGEVSENWTLQVRNQDAANGECVDIWVGTVNSIAAPDVLTLTYSVDSPVSDCYYFIDNLTVGQGANTIWGFPDFGINSGNSLTTTVTYPALNADNDTNPQAYWGLAGSSGTMSNGSTGSFDYTTVTAGQIAVNLDVYPGGNPWQPTAPTTSGKFATAGIVVEASISTAASTAAVPNAVLAHISSPNSFEPFSSYELQLGFAEVPAYTALGTYNTISNGVVEAFGGYDAFNIWTYPTNPLDGGWHYIVKSSGLSVEVNGQTYVGVPYLDGVAPTGGAYSTTIGGDVAGLTFGTPPQGQSGINPNPGNDYNVDAQPFTGILDEVALYDSNLTTTQITNHFNTARWFQTTEYGGANGDVTAGRTNKVLAVAGLDPSTIFAVPYNFATLLYSETDSLISTSALNYIQTTSETEPALIFQGTNGLIYGFNREYQYLNETSTTSQAIISDSSNSPYYYDGPSLQIAGDDLDIWSDIQVQSGIPSTLTTDQIEVGVLQEWGPAQSALAAYSASVYGNRTLQGLTALQFAYDSDARTLAQYYLSIYALPRLRITQMTLNAQGNNGANIPLMIQRGLYDRFTIQYTGQTPGPTFSQDSLIEQVSHAVDMSIPEWSTTYAMSVYEVLLNAFYLDTSTMDGPDVLVL